MRFHATLSLGIAAVWLALLALLGLSAMPAAAHATACDFSSAHHITIDLGRRWPIVSDPAIMQAPADWIGDSFWLGYDAPDPFDGFLRSRSLYTVRYLDETNHLVGIIWIGYYGESTVRALMIDPRGRANGDHGCAAITLPRRVVDQWVRAAVAARDDG